MTIWQAQPWQVDCRDMVCPCGRADDKRVHSMLEHGAVQPKYVFRKKSLHVDCAAEGTRALQPHFIGQ